MLATDRSRPSTPYLGRQYKPEAETTAGRPLAAPAEAHTSYPRRLFLRRPATRARCDGILSHIYDCVIATPWPAYARTNAHEPSQLTPGSRQELCAARCAAARDGLREYTQGPSRFFSDELFARAPGTHAQLRNVRSQCDSLCGVQSRSHRIAGLRPSID